MPTSSTDDERVVMTPHVHISAVHIGATVLATFAVFATLHLLALGNDNRASRALIAAGF